MGTDLKSIVQSIANHEVEEGRLLEIPLSLVEGLATQLSCNIVLVPNGYISNGLISTSTQQKTPSNSNLSTPNAFVCHVTGGHPILEHLQSSIKASRLSGSSSTFTTTGGAYGVDKKKEKVRKVPRPRNAFIIYRGEKHDDVMAHGNISNTCASRVIAQMWREEPVLVKEHYRALALEESLQHKSRHPEYRYTPRKPGEKQRRCRRKNFNEMSANVPTSETINSFDESTPELELEPVCDESALISCTDANSSNTDNTQCFSEDLFTLDSISSYFTLDEREYLNTISGKRMSFIIYLVILTRMCRLQNWCFERC
ncbi:hypothetical protein V1512DRAFT_213723 [Lipomyces arxii]|uniref:uncharacterized protein n=1 Tax=Lipomyces arxii TaxID=56418 RepID=UPI0034CDCA64